MNDVPLRTRLAAVAVAVWASCICPPAADADTAGPTIAEAARRVVKIYGAGGVRGMEAYQTGVLVGPQGHVLTVMSTVLDSEEIACVLDDGIRYRGTVLGADPRRQLAVLSLDAVDLPFFPLLDAEPVEPGTRIFALSNLFGVAVGDERVSTQHGVVAARVPLAARRGSYEVPFTGDVYILDCTTNNPGSPGGAVIDRRGRLIGMLGKELRAASSGIWLSYAIPAGELARGYQDIIDGSVPAPPATAVVACDPRGLGIVLVPDLLDRTPPFIESIVPGSPAERAGLLPDDLVIAVAGKAVQSRQAVQQAVGGLPIGDAVLLAVVRDGHVVEVDLGPRPPDDHPAAAAASEENR